MFRNIGQLYSMTGNAMYISGHAPYLPSSTMIAMKKFPLFAGALYSPKNLRRDPKLASRLAKIPYYIMACLL